MKHLKTFPLGTSLLTLTILQWENITALKNLWPMLVTGDEFWQDYSVEVQVRMLSTISPAHAGIMYLFQINTPL